MSAARVLGGLGAAIGIPTAIGAGVGAAVPVRAKSEKARREERTGNIASGAAVGALLGLSAAPMFMGPAAVKAPRRPRTYVGTWPTAHTPFSPSGVGSWTHTPPKVNVGKRVKPPSSRVRWGPSTSGSTGTGAPSYKQYAKQPPPKPPPAGQRGRAKPSGGPQPAAKPPSKEEQAVARIAQKLGLPKNPSSKAEINKVLKQKAKKLHSDVGGNAEELKDVTRWHSYWKNKVAHFHPHFQDGFVEELSKIASF